MKKKKMQTKRLLLLYEDRNVCLGNTHSIPYNFLLFWKWVYGTEFFPIRSLMYQNMDSIRLYSSTTCSTNRASQGEDTGSQTHMPAFSSLFKKISVRLSYLKTESLSNSRKLPDNGD